MKKNFNIRIETDEKEDIAEVLRCLEKGFCVESSVRSYQKRNSSGYLHYFKISPKEDGKPVGLIEKGKNTF